jgi:hypothetical protein
MHVRISRLSGPQAEPADQPFCSVFCSLGRAAVRSEALTGFYAHPGCRPVRIQGFPLVTKPVAGWRALRYALCQQGLQREVSALSGRSNGCQSTTKRRCPRLS